MKRETKPLTCLIVCNGHIDKRLLQKLLKTHRSFKIISTDGASNTLKSLKVIPHYIVGDLDSIKPSVLSYYRRKGVKIRKIPEQEHTDFEKSINLAMSLKLKSIAVIGYGGKRIDHTINNFSVMKRYYKKTDIRFLDTEFEIFYTNKTTVFKYRKGDTISFLGMPKAEGVKTHGLLYPFRNEPLEFGVREGVLNEATKSIIKIEVKKGEILIFKKHYYI